MARLGRDDEDLAGREPVCHALDDELELAGNHADNLFVRMMMLGKHRSSIDVDPRMRNASGVNQPRAQPRKNLPHRHSIDLNQRHRPTLHHRYLPYAALSPALAEFAAYPGQNQRSSWYQSWMHKHVCFSLLCIRGFLRAISRFATNR